jgi:hypothetical protein
MATNLPIPLTTLDLGTREFGPVPVDDVVTQTTLTIDRTVSNGLNSQPATTKVEIGVWQSDDGGATWQFRASAGLIGGIYPSNRDGDPYLASNVSVDLTPGTGRRVRADVTVEGASVAVAGSLLIE